MGWIYDILKVIIKLSEGCTNTGHLGIIEIFVNLALKSQCFPSHEPHQITNSSLPLATVEEHWRTTPAAPDAATRNEELGFMPKMDQNGPFIKNACLL